MNFSEAVESLLNGKRLARAGWNGFGQWVCYMPGTVIPESLVNARTKKFVPHGDLRVGPYFVLMTAKGVWQPGWVASQGDMVADDWELLPDEVPGA